MAGYKGLCSDVTVSQTINGKHSSADMEGVEKWCENMKQYRNNIS
jgi:hypothetical protein